MTEYLATEIQTLIRQFSTKVESADDLLETGTLDSVNVVRLLLAIEARFGVAIPIGEVDIDSFRTVARIADLVQKCQPTKTVCPMNLPAAVSSFHHASNETNPAGPGLGPTEQDAMVREIDDLFRDSLLVEVASPDEDLFRAGTLDSLSLVNLIMLLEARFSLRLSLEDLDVGAFRTIKSIAQLVRKVSSGR